MLPKPIRGETTGNPFAGFNRGVDGFASDTILGLVGLALSALPWLFSDEDIRNVSPYASAAAGLYGLYMFGKVALRIRRRVAWLEVNEQGLLWSQSGQTLRKSWADVKSFGRTERFSRGVAIGAVKVQFHDGAPLEFNRMLSSYDQLADAIQGRAAAELTEAKERDLADGHARFGPVTLSNTGVTCGDRKYGWAEFDYGIWRGCLVFVPPGEEISPHRFSAVTPLEMIPDYAVLLQLMARHGKPPAEREEVGETTRR